MRRGNAPLARMRALRLLLIGTRDSALDPLRFRSQGWVQREVAVEERDGGGASAQLHLVRLVSVPTPTLRSVDLRYNFRLRPGRDALAYLSREWGMCRWVWNRLTAESKDRHLDNQIAVANGCHKDALPTFGYAEQDKYLTHLRATTRDVVTGEHWLACGSSVAQQQTVRDFARARSKALSDRMSALPLSQQRGLPRFKSRHGSLPSLNYTSRGFKVEPHPETGRLALRLPGKVFIPVV